MNITVHKPHLTLLPAKGITPTGLMNRGLTRRGNPRDRYTSTMLWREDRTWASMSNVLGGIVWITLRRGGSTRYLNRRGQQDVFGPDFAESGRGLRRCNFLDYAGNYFAPKAGELARPVYDYDTTPFYQSTRVSGIIDPKVVNLFFWINSYCLRWRFICRSCLQCKKGTFVSRFFPWFSFPTAKII